MKAISEETKQRRSGWVAWFAVLVVVLSFALMYDQGRWLADWKWFLSSESLVRKLDSGNTKVVEDVLDILEARADSIGRERAVQLLESKDGNIWFYAASYLGKIKDERSTPYLIRAMGLPSRGYQGEAWTQLRWMTGVGLDMKQDIWILWWRRMHPDSEFVFACPKR